MPRLLALPAVALLAACGTQLSVDEHDRLRQPQEDCPPVAAPPADFCGPNASPVLVACNWTCAAQCPVANRPICEAGERLVVVTDTNGCDFPTCAVCPAVAAPPADFCGPGARPVLVTDTSGCESWRCQTVCPVANRPLCSAGEQLILLPDANGCEMPVCLPTRPVGRDRGGAPRSRW